MSKHIVYKDEIKDPELAKLESVLFEDDANKYYQEQLSKIAESEELPPSKRVLIRPQGLHVLIALKEPSVDPTVERAKKLNLIITTNDGKETPDIGVIESIGSLVVQSEYPDFVPGATVIYKKYAGDEILGNGKKYLILHVDDILASVYEIEENQKPNV